MTYHKSHKWQILLHHINARVCQFSPAKDPSSTSICSTITGIGADRFAAKVKQQVKLMLGTVQDWTLQTVINIWQLYDNLHSHALKSWLNQLKLAKNSDSKKEN